MQVRPNVTYGVRMSSVSRRKRRRGGGFKKALKVVVILAFIVACVGFVKYGIIDYINSSDKAESYIASGDECMSNGDFDGALKNYNKALGTEGDNADAFAGKGDAYTALKKYEDAQKAYDSALKNDEKCERALRGLVKMNFEKGDADSARNCFAKARKAGIQFKDDEWAILTKKVPEKTPLAVADNDMQHADGKISVTDTKVIFTSAKGEETLVYEGSSLSKKFASNGVSIYVYDVGLQQIILVDIATGLDYAVTDVYAGADGLDEFYGKGRFCGCTETYLYFSEQHGENEFKTYYLATKTNKFYNMKDISLKSIVSTKNKLYYVSNDSALCSCGYDGSDLKEISSAIKDKKAVDNFIIYTVPVEGYVVDVFKYNMDNDETIQVGSGLKVHSIVDIYVDAMVYNTINEVTMATTEEILEY